MKSFSLWGWLGQQINYGAIEWMRNRGLTLNNPSFWMSQLLEVFGKLSRSLTSKLKQY